MIAQLLLALREMGRILDSGHTWQWVGNSSQNLRQVNDQMVRTTNARTGLSSQVRCSSTHLVENSGQKADGWDNLGTKQVLILDLGPGSEAQHRRVQD